MDKAKKKAFTLLYSFAHSPGLGVGRGGDLVRRPEWRGESEVCTIAFHSRSGEQPREVMAECACQAGEELSDCLLALLNCPGMTGPEERLFSIYDSFRSRSSVRTRWSKYDGRSGEKRAFKLYEVVQVRWPEWREESL